MTLEYTHQEDWREIEASLLQEDDPDVLNAFLRLTDEGALHLRTDPRGENLKWDTWNPPPETDLVLDAAVRFLMEWGYVEDVTRLAKSDYLVRASQKARDVRAVYDRLPERAAGSPSDSPQSAR